MADDVTLPAASGTFVVASDDIGGRQFQRMKLTFGVDGVATDVSATDPLPVKSLDTAATGSLTALNAAVTLSGLNGQSSGLVQLDGTWVGSVTIEASNDGFTTTNALYTTQAAAGAPSTSPLTATGVYRVLGVAGYAAIRARCSAFTSGSITVTTLKASPGNGVQGVVSVNASHFLATVSQGGTWNVGLTGSLQAGSAIVGKFGIDQTTPGTTNLVSIGTNGTVAINAAIPTGANVIGAVTQSGTWNIGSITTLPTLANVTTVGTVTTVSTVTAVTGVTNGVAIAPSATVGGYTTFATLVAAATTNATSVKASAGTLGMIFAHNNTASVKYIKIFNKASAPTVGTDTPVLNLPIPANSFIDIVMPAGIRFATGIAYAVTGGQALLDTTVTAAGDVVLNIAYI